MKKFILLMCLAVISATTASGYDYCIPNDDGIMIYYDFDIATNNVPYLTVVAGDTPYSGDIVIPKSVNVDEQNQYSVWVIGMGAFKDCANLTSVCIPDISYIWYEAFENCTGLISVKLPEKVLWDLLDRAFANCSSLTSVDLPQIDHMGEDVFQNCTALTDVKLTKNSDIGWGAFRNCTGLTSVNIPDNSNIGYRAFEGCTGLTSVNIPDNSNIGSSAFEGCTGLTSVKLPNNSNIGNSAFSWCTGPTSVFIPESVKLGYGIFSGCINLESFDGSYTSADHRCLINDNKLLAFAPSGITHYDIPSSVTEIGSGTFSNCTNLISINIPESVTIIGGSAFNRCTNLSSINIPESVTNIWDSAFYMCTGLTSIYIPESVTYIGSEAFAYCTNLSEINIPKQLTEISGNLFRSCTSLTSITLPPSIETIGECAFYACTNLSSVNIPKAVTKLGMYAFAHCKSITEIDIPEHVTELGEGIFANCPISTITIPSSTNYIGPYAFYGCTNLSKVKFSYGENARPLSWDIFYYSDNYGYSLTSPFGNCTNLNEVIVERELDGTKAASWFYEKPTFEWWTMFSTEFDTSTNLVYFANIEDITIGIQTLQTNNIQGINSIKSIIFTDRVETIEEMALKNCSGIEKIECQGTVPPALGSGSFTDEQYDTITVTVPKGSLYAYRSDPEWNKFLKLQETGDVDGTTDILLEREDSYDVYTTHGICVKRNATADDLKNLAPGIYIYGGKKIIIR